MFLHPFLRYLKQMDNKGKVFSILVTERWARS